ncbi:MAG: hypothetical protein KJ728_11780 [Alphaproteobacteria bacterium]|uniref:Uncharacterized protein n=1 Tax=viral metagenome TaxID=1070528 RepID=A0A6M3XBU4_9ZZZZ|nr:hypothetical protein [Alphaproteobacteria bacterium]
MTAAPRMAVLEVSVLVEVGGKSFTTQVAGSFDALRSVEAARGAGRAIGEQVGESLALRLQHGERLS